MGKPIPAAQRNALFPFMVQRKNPLTGRWLNVSAQHKESVAIFVKEGIEGKGYESRVIRK